MERRKARIGKVSKGSLRVVAWSWRGYFLTSQSSRPECFLAAVLHIRTKTLFAFLSLFTFL